MWLDWEDRAGKSEYTLSELQAGMTFLGSLAISKNSQAL